MFALLEKQGLLIAIKAWLQNWLTDVENLWPHLITTYGKEDASKWFYRWQVFFMACAELFAHENGDTWGLGHYVFEK